MQESNYIIRKTKTEYDMREDDPVFIEPHFSSRSFEIYLPNSYICFVIPINPYKFN